MLGSAVRMLREQGHLTQEELASRAELEPSLIARIEAGEADPTWGDARRIAAALGETGRRLPARAGDDGLLARGYGRRVGSRSLSQAGAMFRNPARRAAAACRSS